MEPRPLGLDSCPWAYPVLKGRASAQRGRSGPEAGAAPRAEPGSPPGGAELSRVLDEVGKLLPHYGLGAVKVSAFVVMRWDRSFNEHTIRAFASGSKSAISEAVAR